MGSRRMPSVFRELAVRLSLGYAIVLLILFSASFLLFFPLATRNMERKIENDLRGEADEFIGLYKSVDLRTLEEQLVREARSVGSDDLFQSVLDPDGRVVITSDNSSWRGFPHQVSLVRQALREAGPVFDTVDVPGIGHKVKVVYARLDAQHVLRIAMPLHHEENFLRGLRRILILTMAVILGVVLLTGWFFLQHAMSRVTAVTRTALAISSGATHRRVPVTTLDDEIDRLARAFNEMLDRIEGLIKAQQDMTDNVAHDLKMPLTRIRLVAETLATSPAGRDVPDLAGTIVEEADRLLEMIRTTLEIRAIETGTAKWDVREVDLADVVQKAADVFFVSAEGKGVRLAVSPLPGERIQGDERRLLRAVCHLIDNAVKYTPAGGQVTVALEPREGQVALVIQDTGIGIAPEVRPHIFERFYRGDHSRSVPGLGLGLSLARSIVVAHRGRIEVESTVGQGSTFTVLLARTMIPEPGKLDGGHQQIKPL